MASSISVVYDDSTFDAPWFVRGDSGDTTLPVASAFSSRDSTAHLCLDLEAWTYHQYARQQPLSPRSSTTARPQCLPLPPELWEQICEFMDNSSFQSSLYSLGLVCRALTPLSNRQLYKYPTIHGSEQEDRFLRCLNLSTAVSVAAAVHSNPAAMLAGRPVHTNASYIRGLQRTTRTSDLFVESVVRRARHLELLPDGFWKRLRIADIAVLDACKSSLAALEICPQSKDALLALVKAWESGSDFLRISHHAPQTAPGALTRFEEQCDDPQLVEEISCLLPTDRKLITLFLHFPNLHQLVLADEALTSSPETVVHFAAKVLPHLRAVVLDSSKVKPPRFSAEMVAHLRKSCTKIRTVELLTGN
ncbi:hypothetical protein HDU86_008183 [Geranomyces michiganensis]|nr:hypothetical protein HDU86_008183 [Geranomyces michiganensis]